jgi:hypothetical protein
MAHRVGSQGTWLTRLRASRLAGMNGMLRILIILSVAAALVVGCAGRPAAPAPPTPAQPVAPAEPPAPGQPVVGAATQVTLVRSPSCGCCGGHADHLAAAGFDVKSVLTDSYADVKAAHAIPTEMSSCHTSLVGRYFVEGHVPAAAIEQLLREQPDIDGIALPGMPPGSPGMGGLAVDGLAVFAVDGGKVIGEFGRFAGVGE